MKFSQSLPNETLSQQVRRGASWSVANVVLMRIANVAIMAVAARLVAPDEFGVFALALTVHALVLNLAELGVASAVARGDLDPDDIAPTAATLAIVSSLLLASFLALYAHEIAAFVGSEDAAGPLRVMALSVALVGPFAVPGAQLLRDFRQDRILIATVVGFIPSSALLLLLAVNGDGAMAFAWSRVVGQLITGIALTISAARLYWPGFNRKVVGPLVKFGIPLAVANLLSQAVLNVDYIIVGRVMTTADVGLYLLAFNIASWPTAAIGSVLNSVIMPAFSRLKEDPTALRGAVERAVRAVATIAAPVAATLFVLADPLVLTLYGSKWVEASHPLRALVTYGFLFGLGLLLANIIIAYGRTLTLFVTQVAALAVLIPLITLGIQRAGLVGVGFAHVVVILAVTLPLYVAVFSRSTGIGVVAILRPIAHPLAAALVSAAFASLATILLPSGLLSLLVGGSAAVVVYGFLAAPLLLDLMPASVASRQLAVRVVSLSLRVIRQVPVPAKARI